MLRLGLCFVAVIGVSANAYAANIEIQFSGAVQSITTTGDPIVVDGTFSIGDTVSGTIIYDPTTPPDEMVTGSAIFIDTLPSFSLTIDGLNFLGERGFLRVLDSPDFGTLSDRYAFVADASTSSANPSTLMGPTVNGTTARLSQLTLLSSVLTTITSLDAPTLGQIQSFPNESDENTNLLSFANGNVVRFDLATLTASEVASDVDGAVPLPAAFTLLLGALGLLFFRNRIA